MATISTRQILRSTIDDDDPGLMSSSARQVGPIRYNGQVTAKSIEQNLQTAVGLPASLVCAGNGH